MPRFFAIPRLALDVVYIFEIGCNDNLWYHLCALQDVTIIREKKERARLT
jgi:hypothetical protein